MKTSSGRPRSFIIILRMRRNGVSAIRPRITPAGAKPNRPALTRIVKGGACAGAGEARSACRRRAADCGSVRWNVRPSSPSRWARWSIAATTKSTGTTIDPAALEADHRHPGRHGVAQLLDQLEEVVGAVDLVDLAGRRIADDDARPVDPPRDRGLRPHEAFALVLGAEIRVRQVLAPPRTCPRGTRRRKGRPRRSSSHDGSSPP